MTRSLIKQNNRVPLRCARCCSEEIRHIVADGDIVMVERVDNFLVGETRVSVPCMGIFELRGGKITA